MSKFAVGEKAILARITKPKAAKYLETIVEICALPAGVEYIGPQPSWNGKNRVPSGCYLVKHYDGTYGATREDRLRKLPGDEKKDFIPPEVRKLFVPNKRKFHVS